MSRGSEAPDAARVGSRVDSKTASPRRRRRRRSRRPGAGARPASARRGRGETEPGRLRIRRRLSPALAAATVAPAGRAPARAVGRVRERGRPAALLASGRRRHARADAPARPGKHPSGRVPPRAGRTAPGRPCRADRCGRTGRPLGRPRRRGPRRRARRSPPADWTRRRDGGRPDPPLSARAASGRGRP
jgi:hypothetical protein